MPKPIRALSLEPYRSLVQTAIDTFWSTRTKQLQAQELRQTLDTGARGAVTGGKHLDGFVALMRQIAMDMGIPADCIHTAQTTLPGFFRASKNWDFLILSPDQKLVAVIEFKSQVGSFGNNFNNRAEEVLGNAVDLWTAFREQTFPNQNAPWMGYLVVVERAPASTRPISSHTSHFQVREEFHDTSYLERYSLLCQKLVFERHYTAAALLWTESDGCFGDVAESVNLETFLRSYMGHLLGHLHLFQI